MDPNATLREIHDSSRYSSASCREYIEYLRTWLDRGGFAPDWSAYPRGARRFARATGRKVLP